MEVHGLIGGEGLQLTSTFDWFRNSPMGKMQYCDRGEGERNQYRSEGGGEWRDWRGMREREKSNNCNRKRDS
jgi:hypothetical protein